MINDNNGSVFLSVLIPCYNVSEYIYECLDSIFDQLTEKCEVIIYDDGSTDDTLVKIKNHKIFLEFGAHVIDGQKNGGISYARNKLIENACGQYIWFIDSDDKILDDAMKHVLGRLGQFNPDILFFDFNVWPKNLTEKMKKKRFQLSSFNEKPGFHQNTCKDLIYNATVKSAQLHPWSKVYKRELFRCGTEFPVGKIFEDVTVMPILSAYAETAYYLDIPLVAYRSREGSIVSSLNTVRDVECLEAINETKNRYFKYIGPLSDKSHLMITFYATWNLRHMIKKIARYPNKHERPSLMIRCLQEFNKIHGRSTSYVLYASLREGGFSHFLHVSKRLIQAHYICFFNKWKPH